MSKIIINGKSDGALKAYKDGSEIGAIYAGGSVVYTAMESNVEPAPPVTQPYLCFTAQEAGSTVSFVKEGEVSMPVPVLYKSTDGNNWTTWDGSVITLPSVNSKVYIYGNNSSFRGGQSSMITTPTTYWHFVMSGIIAASGDITTMLDIDGVTGFSDTYTFYKMFEGCTSLTTPPELPAMGLSAYCYYDMFRGCTSLTSAPELPATEMPRNCYQDMFYGCTSLTTPPPVLPARNTQQYSYSGMFEACTSLTTAPVISAWSIAKHCCQNMFARCTSLATAPVLSATTLYEYCYFQMFQGCTSLTTAPVLPATIMANRCYSNMFYGCTSLTMAPDLRHVTSLAPYSCLQMFQGCTNLNKAYAPTVSSWDTNVFSDWLIDVAASGTVYVKTLAMQIKVPRNSTSGCPSGWSVFLKSN